MLTYENAVKNPRHRYMASRGTESYNKSISISLLRQVTKSVPIILGVRWLTGCKLYKSLFSPSSIKRTTAYDRPLVSFGILACHSRDLLQCQEKRGFLLAKLKLTKIPNEQKSLCISLCLK